MSLLDRTLAEIDRGRTGKIQCIPTSIQKLNEHTEGLEQARMILVGAETSVGKTTFVRDQYMHGAYEYIRKINDPNIIDAVWVDFSLEMRPETNMAAAMSRKLFQDYGKVIPTKRILKNLDDDSRAILETYRPYFEDFQKRLIVVDSDLTPDKYHDYLMQIAKIYGKFTKETRFIGDCEGYTLNNPNLYIIIIVDTINLGEMQGDDNNVKRVIDRISRISVHFRNKCKMIPIIIQQFNAEISTVDRSRYGIKTPMLRDFEDSKRPVKDADIVIGLYDPSRHMKEDENMFRGYNIEILRSWFRSAHILKNRYGENNKFIPMKFNGAVGMFAQLLDAINMDEKEYINSTRP